MSGHFGTPGIGGSLGMCAVCGENFLLNILTNETVKTLPKLTVRKTVEVVEWRCPENLLGANAAGRA